jgi:hypothetical protein
MSKNQQESSEAATMTPEQMAEFREKAIKHYKKEIDFLQAQCDYEKLLADIEEHRARKLSALAHQMQFYPSEREEADQETAPPAPEAPAPKKRVQKRKLKKN